MPRAKYLVIFLIAAACLADNLTYMRIDRTVIEKRLQPIPATDKDRVETIRSQFKSAGCAPELIQEQTIPDEELPNLICVVPGPDPGAIVVGTHLDSKAKGEEAGVDWGGPVMLPLLAESLNSAPHHQTYIFAAFAGHDQGAAGANYFLAQLSDTQRAQIQGMIAIEKVGRSPATYAFADQDRPGMTSAGRRPVPTAAGHEPTTLSKVLPLAASGLKMAAAPQHNSEVAPTAAKVFEEAKIPSIVIHSPAYAVINPPGKMEQVRLSRTELDPKTYTDTYNLMCVYLLYLDKVYYLAHGKAAAEQASRASAQPPQNDALSPAESSSRATVASNEPSSSRAPVSAADQPRNDAAPAESAPSNPVFRATTRLVQVDVVATDKHGRPVPGLKADQFTVLQDGKPQKVRVFEPHVPAQAVADSKGETPAGPKLPPNVFSNLPTAPTVDSWIIILFDVLNTPTSDQAYARKQLTEMLKTLPKGHPVALYLLTNRLTMIQGFTDDPEKMMAAAESLSPSRSHVLTTEAQRQQQEGRITATTSELMANAPSGTLTDNDLITQTNAAKVQQLRDLESFQLADRAKFTMAALEGLSRAVSGYPGRKNLIWLSAGFPIQLMADEKNPAQPWRNTKNFQEAVSETSTLLAKSRIAVYPTDVRGLQGRGVDITVSAAESGQWTAAQNSQGYGNLIGQQTGTFASERKTMMEVAEITGGQAFMGTNDVKLAMQHSIDDGSTYYTLAYTPDKIDPESAFHRIEVKLDQPDTKLSYRRGYYSAGLKTTKPEVGVAALRGALQPGMPAATMVFFTAQVLPPDDKHKDVRITYIVNPNSITFEDVADQKKRIALDCIAIAYDKEGHEIAHASDTLDGAIPASAYETVMAHGVPAKQEISLKPGVYNLRLGVMDRSSQQIGTLDVPMVIPETAAAKK